MRAAALRPEEEIEPLPFPYASLATAALQRRAIAQMQVAALQRTDPARFAAIQRHVAASRMRAAALRPEEEIEPLPFPYASLATAALQRRAIAQMQAARLRQAAPARFAAVQRQAVAAQMRAAALQAQLGIRAYPIPYGGLSGAVLQRQAVATQMRAAALQAQLGIRAYPIPYSGLSGAVLQRQTAARAQASQSRRATEIRKRLLQIQQARAQKAKRRR